MKRAEEAALKAYPDDNFVSVEYADMCRSFYQDGYEQAEIDLGWHSVEESLPPVDEEVIVLTDELNLHCFHKIGFAHIVNQEATVDIDGKPYKPISHNGWNIPGVDYWMPCPKLKEEEK